MLKILRRKSSLWEGELGPFNILGIFSGSLGLGPVSALPCPTPANLCWSRREASSFSCQGSRVIPGIPVGEEVPWKRMWTTHYTFASPLCWVT